MSRDPIANKDFVGIRDSQNIAMVPDYSKDGKALLYVFVLNNPNRKDMLGLYTVREASDIYTARINCRGLAGGALQDCQLFIWENTSDLAHFNMWHNVELADMAWVSELPHCPKKLCVVEGWFGATASNPDSTKWNNPSTWTIHPSPTHFEMRSKRTPGGHGQQCCYKRNGDLVTGGGQAPGNADRVYYGDVLGHIAEDKVPADIAIALNIFNRYLEVRPSDTGGP